MCSFFSTSVHNRYNSLRLIPGGRRRLLVSGEAFARFARDRRSFLEVACVTGRICGREEWTLFVGKEGDV